MRIVIFLSFSSDTTSDTFCSAPQSNANSRKVFILYDRDSIIIQAVSHNTKTIRTQIPMNLLVNLSLILQKSLLISDLTL